MSHASMSLYPEYEKRIELLQQFNYVDGERKVNLKGRVACTMGMNELLITELVMKGKLTRYQPAQVAALLSGLVFQAKTVVELSGNLKQGILEITEVFEELRTAERRLKILDDSVKDLNFGLSDVVYEWAMAKPFAEIMQMTDVQEGIIVRCIQQLNETLCDVREVARIIGETQLQSKMEEASAAVKRDIVFAASLYTQQDMAFV